MDVEGVITLSIPPGKKAEHLGMRVEFVGRIDMVRPASIDSVFI